MRFQKLIRENLFLILIVLLASVLRLFELGNIPVSLSDDEIREVYTAYSVAKTGMDAYGHVLPLVFPIENINTFGPAPIYIRSLLFLFMDLSPFTARLPYSLASIFSIILIFGIANKVVGNKSLALFSAFVAAVSYWQIQMGRFAIETNIGILLLLLGIYFFLVADNRLRLILLSMFFFVLSFYSYAAFKVIFLPLILILLWYKSNKLSSKNLLVVISTVIFAFSSFALLSITSDASKYAGPNGAGLLFLNKENIAQTVEIERRNSQIPYPFENLYHNKITYLLDASAKNYLAVFSPEFLVMGEKETSGIYSIWGKGAIYWFEILLLILGITFFLRQKRREGLFFLMLLLISPLPSAIGVNNPTWMARSMFFVIWLNIFIAGGVYFLFTQFRKRKLIFFLFIGVLYFHSVLGYLLAYYYDWSRTNAKHFNNHSTEMVKLIHSYSKAGREVVVLGVNSENTFMRYAFYNKIEPEIVQESILHKPIVFNNLTFKEDCFFDDKNAIQAVLQEKCELKSVSSSVIKDSENNVIYSIYEK